MEPHDGVGWVELLMLFYRKAELMQAAQDRERGVSDHRVCDGQVLQKAGVERQLVPCDHDRKSERFARCPRLDEGVQCQSRLAHTRATRADAR